LWADEMSAQELGYSLTLSESYRRLGESLLWEGRFNDDTRHEFVRSVAVAREEVARETNPAGLEGANVGLCEALNALGDLQAARGDLTDAAASYDESNAVSLANIALAIDPYEFSDCHARSLRGLADIAILRRDFGAARGRMEEEIR